MTRRLLALFAPGLLMAQNEVVLNGNRVVSIKQTPSIPRPRNGQCPQCGTMAPTFSWGKGVMPYMHFADDAGFDFGPARGWRVFFCAHCNTAFRQWAEGKEPKR